MNFVRFDRDNMPLRISQVVLVLALVATAAYAALGIAIDAWQLKVLAAAVGLVALLSAAAWLLVRRSYEIAGIGLIIIGLLLLSLATSFLLEGFSFFIAVILLMLIWPISSITLPRELLRLTLAATVVVGIATILFDLFGLSNRFTAPQVQTIIGLFTIVIAFLSGLVLAQSYRNYSLQTKFVTAVIVLAIVSIAATTFFVTRTIRTISTEQIGQDLHNVAESKALVLGEVLARQLSTLQTFQLNQTVLDAVREANAQYSGELTNEKREEIDESWHANANDPLARRISSNSGAAVLKAFSENFSNLQQPIIVDKYSGIVATTHYPEHFFQSEEIWWRALTNNFGEGQPFISSPHQVGEVFQIVLAIPLIDQGELIGAVKVNYVLDELAPMLSAGDDLGNTGELGLIIGSQEYVSNPETGITKRGIVLTNEQVSRLKSELYISTRFNGADNFMSRADVQSSTNNNSVNLLDWYVLAHQEREEALRVVSLQQRTQILIGVMIVIVGGIAASLVGRLVAGPILRLAEVARQIEAGDRNVRAPVESDDEIGALASTFNSMVNQLQRVEQNLETRVAERTRALETSARVSRSLSNILNRNELVEAVVKQTQEAFNYYHVQLFLVEPATGRFKMVGGTGRAGELMLAQNHSLNRGEGVVGRAAYTNAAVLVSDVQLDPNWKPNPLLPDTKTEAAVPISIGNRVLGVLDVQDTEVGSLRQRDIELLELIANQVAIGLQNAEAYEKIQQDAQREALLDDITQKIRQTTDIESAMRAAAVGVGRALHSLQTKVQLRPEGEKKNGSG